MHFYPEKNKDRRAFVKGEEKKKVVDFVIPMLTEGDREGGRRRNSITATTKRNKEEVHRSILSYAHH